jgi:hypothetical protein
MAEQQEQPKRTRMEHCLADLGAPEVEAVLQEHDVFEEVALLVAVAMASIDLGLAADAVNAMQAPGGLALPEAMERAKQNEVRAMLAAAKQRWSLLVGALTAVPEDGFGVEAQVTRKAKPAEPIPFAGGDEGHNVGDPDASITAPNPEDSNRRGSDG